MIQVDPDTGIVWRPVGYGGERRAVYWARCPDCGPQPPTTETLAHRGGERVLATFHRPGELPLLGRCSACGRAPVPLREAMTPASRNKTGGACTRRCWQGKSACRCACRGRCHGEGRCYCAEGFRLYHDRRLE